MSNQPSDPFGRGDRTIIRPNPAGRRPAPAAAPTPPPASPASPARTPAPAPAIAAPPGDDWVAAPEAAPRPAEAPARRAVVLKRDIVVAPHENPIMRAAGPLLLLLGRLRVALSRAPFAHLMEQVAASIEDFEKDIRAGGIPAEQAKVAKYIVCATADDIVQNIPGDDRHVWTQYSMLSRFFGERIGGVRFFQELDRAKVDPSGNYPLLELQHACLALGFQGIHRTSGGGAAMLQQIQRNLYETMRRVRKANHELSPRWQGLSLATRVARFQVPVWAVAAVVGVALLGLYLILRMLLGGGSEALADTLLKIHPSSDISIQRRVFVPAPPPPPVPPSTQIGRIRTALAGDISSGKLSVQDAGGQIVIRFAEALFAPAEAMVRDEFKPTAARIVAILEREPGAIKVIGHTDNIPIRTVRFPSNWQLSVERAKAVGDLLKAGLTHPERMEVEGKGADVPIAPNDTREGRAKNRRVEIFIARSG